MNEDWDWPFWRSNFELSVLAGLQERIQKPGGSLIGKFRNGKKLAKRKSGGKLAPCKPTQHLEHDGHF
jgi:hypothetical protein